MRTYTRRDLFRRALRVMARAPIGYVAAVETIHRAQWSRSSFIAWIADLIDRVLPH
jgi:hypothetical protein